jgi:diguanylate cyclase (GGDEF)-like protein
MISLKKYLDLAAGAPIEGEPEDQRLLSVAKNAYGAALLEMGDCSMAACPAMGDGLKRKLGDLKAGLSGKIEHAALLAIDTCARTQLREWGRGTARHSEQKTNEVKELLLAMARTAESVSTRDQRSAVQMSEITQRLKTIASLDDLTEIRASIEKSAAELKMSIDRMAAEGKAVLDQLREQVASYQSKLERAEEVASRDGLTGLSNRLYVEKQIGQRIEAGGTFCIALIDIDGFKKVNDEYGHLTGDEVLKQFARELVSARRATDVVGRWGGDEFILLLNCDRSEAETQTIRLRNWICGNYKVRRNQGETKLQVNASIGLADYRAGQEMKKVIERADAAMYEQKAASRGQKTAAERPAAESFVTNSRGRGVGLTRGPG